MIADIQIEQIPYYLTWRIRQEVMYPGQPIESVKLPDDAKGLHFGLYVNTKLVSVISLFENPESTQLRKFATLEIEQHKGYGTLLFKYVLEFCKDQNIHAIWCNARISAISFYNTFGFRETGNEYALAELRYIKMKRSID